MDVPFRRSPSAKRPRFATISWTRIRGISAGRANARRDLGQLCRDYWPPLYAFLRRGGMSVHDAEDTIQGFMSWVVESRFVEKANASQGRFRNFLLVALRQYLSRHEPAVRVALHRMRRRYAEILRGEIAATLGPGDDVNDDWIGS